jgi:hypothetical protein
MFNGQRSMVNVQCSMVNAQRSMFIDIFKKSPKQLTSVRCIIFSSVYILHHYNSLKEKRAFLLYFSRFLYISDFVEDTLHSERKRKASFPFVFLSFFVSLYPKQK